MYKRILTAVTAIVLLCLPTAWAADTSATAAILMDGDTGEALYSCESACAITGSMILHTHNTLISDSPPVRPYDRTFRKFSP